MPASKSKSKTPKPGHQVVSFYLEELHFDPANPRYGVAASKITNDREALDHIVDVFGVDDVLSSIAVNGFFDTEPLVGIRNGKKEVRILEGNRRLAACLILAGDPRAAGQQRLHDHYSPIHEENGSKRITPIPVILYEGKDAMKNVLPYLGVRHIVGFMEWDSYAKAAWVDTVLRENDLPLKEVMEMIGDKNGTIPRMLAGLRFVKQLISAGEFRPDQSQRGGRGSNPEYPFSWVYTALDNAPVRDFVGFKEEPDGTPAEKPVPQEKLEQAGWVMRFLFGDRQRGIAPVIDDSRQIGELAKAIRDPVLCMRLREGKSVRLVMEEARPSEERLLEGFTRIADQLQDLGGLIVPGTLKSDVAATLVEPARAVSNLAKKALADVRRIAEEDESLEDGE